MNKLFIYAVLAVVGAIAFTNFNLSAEDPRPTQGDEYLTILYAGRHNSYALYPNGKAQFFPELANLSTPERVDDRVFALHTLINKFAKEGYILVETPEMNRVVMKKKSSN